MKKQFIINTEGLTVYYDSDIMAQIEKKLGALSSEKYKVLKNAINATARQAKKDIAEKAQEEYTAKKGAISKVSKLKNATASNPDATITVTGKTMELKKYKTRNPKSGSQAQILASGGMKPIQSKKGTKAKAFLATFASGHTAIVQRQDGKTYTGQGAAKRKAKWGSGADMTAIKSLLSISYPKMVGGEKVYGELAPEIYENLMENVQKEIRKVLEA